MINNDSMSEVSDNNKLCKVAIMMNYHGTGHKQMLNGLPGGNWSLNGTPTPVPPMGRAGGGGGTCLVYI